MTVRLSFHFISLHFCVIITYMSVAPIELELFEVRSQSSLTSVHGDSPDKNTGVGCYALLKEIFPTQE